MLKSINTHLGSIKGGRSIQKAMGHKDIKTTMIYVDVAKPHIQEQVAKLDRIPLAYS